MIRKQEHSSPRGGFTLIELLVVIAIIAVLVSLTTAAVMQVMRKIPETKTRVEIGQLDAALSGFSQDHNSVPLPSTLTLRENGQYPAGDPTGNFLRRAFGKNIGAVDWNQNGQIDTVTSTGAPYLIVLTGAQCLVFYCGGPGGTHGFSNNNSNPMSAQGTPYYQFVSSRLKPDPNATANNSTQFPVYWDGYSNPPNTGVPYAFFSTNGVTNGYNVNDCSSIGAQPYWDTTPGNWVNPTSYQIISAGRLGVFGGSPGNGAGWSSTNGSLDPNGKDDQANFAPRLLMAGAQ